MIIMESHAVVLIARMSYLVVCVPRINVDEAIDIDDVHWVHPLGHLFVTMFAYYNRRI
jgi:hypothetical protein